MPVPSPPGPVRRISPALRQNCIRSWRNHQLGTEAKPKNLSLERSRLTPPPPFPQVGRPTTSPHGPPNPPRDPCHAPPPASRGFPAAPRRAARRSRAQEALRVPQDGHRYGPGGHRPATDVALGATGPQSLQPWGPRARSMRPGGPLAHYATREPDSRERDEGATGPQRPATAETGPVQARERADAKAPGSQDGYRAGGSDFVTGDKGFSAGGRGGPRRVGLHVGTWGRSRSRDLGEVPYRGPGGEVPAGETAMGEWPGGG